MGLSKGEKVGVIVSNCVEMVCVRECTHGLVDFRAMYEKGAAESLAIHLQDADIKYVFVRVRKFES
jgi:hypothetical protein